MVWASGFHEPDSAKKNRQAFALAVCWELGVCLAGPVRQQAGEIKEEKVEPGRHGRVIQARSPRACPLWPEIAPTHTLRASGVNAERKPAVLVLTDMKPARLALAEAHCQRFYGPAICYMKSVMLFFPCGNERQQER
jgi:hypothetical protein